MKKLIYAFMVLATVLVGCTEKEDDNSYKFEGSQWIAEEVPSELGLDLKGETLFDVGVSTQGKMTIALIVQKNSNMGVEDGDIIILNEHPYSCVKSDESGKKYSLQYGEDFYNIEFINKNTIKFFITQESYYIFTRASKSYSLANAKKYEDLTVSLIPSVESDWAGGKIEFSLSNGNPIKSIKFDVVSQNVTVYNDMNSILEDNVITLGFYEANGKIANASMVITATDYNGKEYWCTIMSKGWRPAFYKEVGEEFKEVDPSQTWERGENCWIGVESYEGEVEYTGNTDSFEGIRYSNTLFDAAGSSNNKICFDIPHTNGYDIFYFWYGEQYSFATKIEITD
jgi:hypothetical protein